MGAICFHEEMTNVGELSSARSPWACGARCELTARGKSMQFGSEEQNGCNNAGLKGKAGGAILVASLKLRGERALA